MVHLCKVVTDVKYDLEDYSRSDFFRAYTTDLALLLSMKDFSLKQHIVENTLIGNTKAGCMSVRLRMHCIRKAILCIFIKMKPQKRNWIL